MEILHHIFMCIGKRMVQSFLYLAKGVMKGSPLVDKGIRHETRRQAVPPSILRLLLPKEVPLNEGYSVFHCFQSRTEELLTPSHRLSHILHIFMSFFTMLDYDTTDIHCNPISSEKIFLVWLVLILSFPKNIIILCSVAVISFTSSKKVTLFMLCQHLNNNGNPIMLKLLIKSCTL